MKLKEFWSRNNLDEMQQQTLLKIEARSFWLLWGMLLAALLIQSLCGFTTREMAAEWIVFMVGCVYTGGACIRAGIWDRHFTADKKTNFLFSLAGGAVIAIWSYVKFSEFGWKSGLLMAGITAVTTILLCFALLQLCTAMYKKRHTELENPKEETDNHENE